MTQHIRDVPARRDDGGSLAIKITPDGLVRVTPRRNHEYFIQIGRRAREKRLLLTHAEAAQLHARLGEALGADVAA